MSPIAIRKPFYSQEHESWAIPLTQEVIALVDADVVTDLARYNWYAAKDGCCWYAQTSPRKEGGKRTTVMMHRVITNAPDKLAVDHKKHRSLTEKVIDNRRANLRLCTALQNQQNKRSQVGRSSSYKGVCWNKNAKKWQAEICLHGRRRHLGLFADELKAAHAYDAEAKKLFGDFALSVNAMPIETVI